MEHIDAIGQNTRKFLKQVQEYRDKKNINNNDNNSQITSVIDRKNQLDLKILICIDISGSISQAQFSQFMRQVYAIKGLSKVKIIETDTEVQAYYDLDFSTRSSIVRLRGGGGTNFDKAFAAAEKINPDALIFMTDGFVGGNPRMPDFPVGWILTNNGVKPYKFGEVIARLV